MSDGQGGRLPKRPCHDFGCNNLRDGARLDFNRGTAGDDLCNVLWNKLLDRLPLYESVVQQQPKSMISRGNAVEQAIGLSYAAATNARYLNDGELDWTRTGSRTSSQSAWAEAWWYFQVLGLGPNINLGPTFGLQAINVPKPSQPPLPADLDHPGGNNGAQAKPPPPLGDAVWLKPSSAAPPAATRPPPTVAVVTAQPPQQPPPPKAYPYPPGGARAKSPPTIRDPPLWLSSAVPAPAATPPVAAVTEAQPKQPPPPPADPPRWRREAAAPPAPAGWAQPAPGKQRTKTSWRQQQPVQATQTSREGCSRC